MLPLLACCAGVYIGLHFSVLALLPFLVLGTGAFIISSYASGHGIFESASNMLVPVILVQVGYMLGLTAREAYGQVLARLNIGQSKRV
jgi:hypothetical protein